MAGRIIAALALLVVAGLAVFWFVTRPGGIGDADIANIPRDLDRGAVVFTAAGCASCHAAPGSKDDARLVLSGGEAFASAFGTFHAPNISPDPVEGIGAWSVAGIVNAIRAGVDDEGAHLYPVLPYAAYQNMTLDDAVAVAAYIRTLPASQVASLPNAVSFPFSIRRLVGGWKFLFLKPGFTVASVPPEAETGRYIAEALAHCGECHTPRNALGALDRRRWLAGAPNPVGKGKIPNITPAGLDWSEDDLVGFFQTGFTPDFDTVGGTMAEVVRNLSTLPEADLRSLAAYLKAVPAVADAPK